MNDFDKAARSAIKRLDEEGFLRWIFPKSANGWKWTGWLETQTVPFPGEPDRRCDTVAAFEHIEHRKPPCAFVIESQSEAKADILQRGGEYALRLNREVFYQASNPQVPYIWGLVVLNLTGAEQASGWAMKPEDFGDFELSVKAKVVTLREIESAEILTQIEANELSWAILAWVPLMSGADRSETVDRWRGIVESKAPESRRGELAWLVRFFAELAKRSDVWQSGWEGWNVLKSQVGEELREEGRKEGRVIGEANGQRKSIFALLRRRFGADLPLEVITMLNMEQREPVLMRWFDAALDVSSLAEFRQQIDCP